MEMLVVWQMEQVLWWSYRVPLKAQKDVKDRRWVDLAHTKYIFRLSYHSTNRWYSFLGYCTIVLESVGLDFDSEHAEYPASNSLCRLVLAPHPRNICWFTLPTSSNIFQHIPTYSNHSTISWCRKSDAYHETSLKKRASAEEINVRRRWKPCNRAMMSWYRCEGLRVESGWINGVWWWFDGNW